MAGVPRAWVRPLQVPGRDYSSSEEMGFRRELEDYLLSVSAGIEQAKTRSDSISSEATKRSLLASLPTGQTEIGYEPGSYLSAFREIDSGTDTVTLGAVHWATSPGGWITAASSDWAEDSSTGMFVYSGSSTRNFYVSWNLTLDFMLTNNVYSSRTSLAGKIEKSTNAGVSWTDVVGSVKESGIRKEYTIYFGYFFLNHVSGSAIVSVSTDDRLRFAYGYANANAWSGATLTSTVQNRTTFPGTPKGVTLNIFPVEYAE